MSGVTKEDEEILRVLGSVASAIDRRSRRIAQLEAEVAALGKETQHPCEHLHRCTSRGPGERAYCPEERHEWVCEGTK